ncbi:MAG: SpoIIE family protein phosphatase [Elainella sp. Prado103]|jgi:sigma-B regulation protein RsbU (phosphoserine phosphatase)|nr:SpoIIE family protein phosphatase [Elainella sp. Prado103]
MSKILIIDDDPVIRIILETTLQEQGYDVRSVESGEAGLATAIQWQPALVICDWLMPGLDGLTVCRQLKAQVHATPFFILLSSRSELDDRVRGLDAGADDFLTKPIEIVEMLARVRAGLRLYQSAQQLQQLAADLQRQKQHLEAELAEAAEYVTSLLPKPMTGVVTSQAVFVPSKQLGGDCFDFYWLDPDYLMFYLLDVSGHGLGSALLSVSIQNLLRSQALPGINFYRPEDVLRGLNDIFQMNDQNPRYFSLWYGIYNRVQNRLTYASAGHPPAILLAGQNPPQIQSLKTRGAPVGMMADTKYVSAQCQIELPSTLFLFSDGAYDFQRHQPWSLDRLIELLVDHHRYETALASLPAEIQTCVAIDSFEDDLSILQFQFKAVE